MHRFFSLLMGWSVFGQLWLGPLAHAATNPWTPNTGYPVGTQAHGIAVAPPCRGSEWWDWRLVICGAAVSGRTGLPTRSNAVVSTAARGA